MVHKTKNILKKCILGLCVSGFSLVIFSYLIIETRLSTYLKFDLSVNIDSWIDIGNRCTVVINEYEKLSQFQSATVTDDHNAHNVSQGSQGNRWDLTNLKWRGNTTCDMINVTSQVWVPTDAATEIFVYSAYYDIDDNNVPSIRVIGVGLTAAQHHVVCLVQWAANSTLLELRPATVEILPENQNKK